MTVRVIEEGYVTKVGGSERTESRRRSTTDKATNEVHTYTTEGWVQDPFDGKCSVRGTTPVDEMTGVV